VVYKGWVRRRGGSRGLGYSKGVVGGCIEAELLKYDPKVVG
jgi:hypothetical protein